MINTLGDGIARPGDGDGALRRIRKHIAGHLYAGAGHLSDLLDLGSTFPDQRAALGRGHDQPQSDGRSRASSILQFLELVHKL